jgi:DNA repair ATPase RecN
MRKLFLSGILTFIFTITVFAQLKHTIVKGETLYSISKKYQVTPEEITKLNPEIKKELKET